MPNAGGLRDRCTFQSETLTPVGGGANSSEWVTQCTVWGRLVMRPGSERLEAGRLEDSAIGTLHVRQSPDTKAIQANWRVQIDSVDYAIVSPPQDRQRTHKWLEMQIKRGVAT